MKTRLKIVLAQQDVSQKHLAEMIGVSSSKISKWCSNYTAFSWHAAYSVSKALGIEMETLFYSEIKTLKLKKKVSLNILKAGDTLLEIASGDGDVSKLSDAVVKVSSLKTGLLESRFVLGASVIQAKPSPVPLVRIDRIFEGCGDLFLELMNYDREITLIFRCPKP